MRTAVVLISAYFIFVFNADAEDCNSSKSLSHLIANSDAISLIQVKDIDLLISRGRLDPLVAIEPIENFKAPLVVSLAKEQSARIFSKYLNWNMLRKYSQFVAFMDSQDGAWVPKECGLLPVIAGQKVIGACELISDLFNDTPYQRENLCTLAYPNYVNLKVLKAEIAKKTLNELPYQGRARITKLEPYQGKNRFYRIYVEIIGRDRAKFFNLSKMTDYSAIKVLFKVDSEEDGKSYRKLFSGSSIKLNGFWTMGNFVINSLE